MWKEQRLEFNLAAREFRSAGDGATESPYVEAIRLLGDLQVLAQDLATAPDQDSHELQHIAWRAAKISEDLYFAAGAVQRRRIAEHRRPDDSPNATDEPGRRR